MGGAVVHLNWPHVMAEFEHGLLQALGHCLHAPLQHEPDCLRLALTLIACSVPTLKLRSRGKIHTYSQNKAGLWKWARRCHSSIGNAIAEHDRIQQAEDTNWKQ